MTRTAGAPIGCQRPSRFWGLGCPKIYHEAEDTLDVVGAVVRAHSVGGRRQPAEGKRPRIDTFFQNTISHRLSPVPPQRRRMPWPRPTVLTASPFGRITSSPGRYRT
ncbi:hypothetical protein [Thiolapillus sp.]|uniref:hypothetical protein n=1 Tax=Thiolapillus sp. TaxID=2017437 RepID=UPI0025CEF52E|nr:hypothetical protein [Thiolapillus sp.]